VKPRTAADVELPADEDDSDKETMRQPSSISPWPSRGVRCRLASECAQPKLGRPDIIMFYGAAQAAFTQFPVQTLAVLTAARTTFCSTTCC
jgi:hypothetical protein